VKEAFLYDRLEENKVRCRLCSHYCQIAPGQRGQCGVRENQEGVLYSLVFGLPVAQHVDPIEKKPLFHFLPGSPSYSIATVGCNMTCRHCQNADISQMPGNQKRIVGQEVRPRQVVAQAEAQGCTSISYTYTEPTVFGEYVFETAQLAQARGLKNVMVTNGYQSPEAVDKLGPVIDGANVDLKAFSDRFYQDICGARLKPVLKAIMGLKERGVWLELTTLLIPGLNDSPQELTELAGWIAANPGPQTPWHISRFHPTYRLTDRPATPASSLTRAFDIGQAAGLSYVYLGNVPGQGGETTFCRRCGTELISRLGFAVTRNRLKDGACPQCGTPLDGIF